MYRSSLGVAPEYANAGRPNCRSSCRSSSRALRTGPAAGGTWDEKTASSRASPPSTGSTYTMSAWVSPVHGRAPAALSIFTARTGLSEGTGLPVNGDRSWGEGDGEGDAGGEGEGDVTAAVGRTGPLLLSTSSPPTTRSVRTMPMATVKVIRCRLHAMTHPAPRQGRRPGTPRQPTGQVCTGSPARM